MLFLLTKLVHRSVARLLLGLVVLAPVLGAQEREISAAREQELFSQIDEMLAAVSGIMGLQARRPIDRELITREAVRELVVTRLAEETSKEEIRLEELFLKKFGLAEDDFDLESQTVDVLTEQATALYDFKTKKLYLATWTPASMQELALVHELVHALQDQHFNLRKYVEGAGNSDGEMARMAVVEGQASWVMTDYVMRQSGRSLAKNRFMAVGAVAASRVEAQEYPVFSAAPLFLREAMLFPYTWGLLFQHDVQEKFGLAGFARVFRAPPASTQQILDPSAYFEGRRPLKPRLPRARPGRRFKKVSEGGIGQLEHSILLRKYIGETEAKDLAPQWRGGRYELFESAPEEQVVLSYASAWANPEDAARYFDFYKKIIIQKSESAGFGEELEARVVGESAAGWFLLERQGAVVTSVEGLPVNKFGTK